LANSPSSKKRVRQSEKHRQANATRRSMMRTYIKSVVTAIEAKDQAAAEKAFKIAEPEIDRATKRNLLHRNKAARIKGQLSKKINALAA